MYEENRRPNLDLTLYEEKRRPNEEYRNFKRPKIPKYENDYRNYNPKPDPVYSSLEELSYRPKYPSKYSSSEEQNYPTRYSSLEELNYPEENYESPPDPSPYISYDPYQEIVTPEGKKKKISHSEKNRENFSFLCV